MTDTELRTRDLRDAVENSRALFEVALRNEDHIVATEAFLSFAQSSASQILEMAGRLAEAKGESE